MFNNDSYAYNDSYWYDLSDWKPWGDYPEADTVTAKPSDNNSGPGTKTPLKFGPKYRNVKFQGGITVDKIPLNVQCTTKHKEPVSMMKRLAKAPRIVGGDRVDLNTWGWYARLSTGGYLCGASIIGQRWLLTAAHAITRSEFKEW